MEQLDQEAKLKSRLQLELHKAEGECCILACSASLNSCCQVTTVNPLTVNRPYSCASAPISPLTLKFKQNSAIYDAEHENHIKLFDLRSGLLDGYVAEKAVLEESLQQKEAQEERLVEELEDLRVKLHQMQGLTTELESLRLKHQELSEEHTLLLRQKEHLSSGLGEREKGE